MSNSVHWLCIEVSLVTPGRHCLLTEANFYDVVSTIDQPSVNGLSTTMPTA